MLVIECVTSRALPPVAIHNRGGNRHSFHPIVLTREFLVKTKLRAVTVADFYHRGGNGPTTTGGAVL